MVSLRPEAAAEVVEWSLIRYVELSLSRYAWHWRQHQKRRSGRELLLINEPVSRVGETGTEMGELLTTVPAADDEYLAAAPLQEVLSDRQLFRAYERLTPHQKLVIRHLVLGDTRQQALARSMNVSQQAVCKTKQQALQRLLVCIRTDAAVQAES